MKNSSKFRTVAIDLLVITAASLVYAVGFNWLFKPNSIAFGGLTGVAQILNALFPVLPIGVTVTVLNIPLFLLGWRLLGGKLLLTSLYAMAASALFIDLCDLIWGDFAPMDPMLATVFGGALLGGALGFIILRGATTGGSDLLARLLKLKLSWLPMGRVLMAIDLTVVIAAALVFHNVNSALYGLLAIFISSYVLDTVLYGTDKAKVAYIISQRSDEVTAHIIHQLDRGATILQGHGAWSKDAKDVIMVAIRQKDIVRLKASIQEIDPDAFLIVCQAHEVLGKGFGTYSATDV